MHNPSLASLNLGNRWKIHNLKPIGDKRQNDLGLRQFIEIWIILIKCEENTTCIDQYMCINIDTEN